MEISCHFSSHLIASGSFEQKCCFESSCCEVIPFFIISRLYLSYDLMLLIESAIVFNCTSTVHFMTVILVLPSHGEFLG